MWLTLSVTWSSIFYLQHKPPYIKLQSLISTKSNPFSLKKTSIQYYSLILSICNAINQFYLKCNLQIFFVHGSALYFDVCCCSCKEFCWFWQNHWEALLIYLSKVLIEIQFTIITSNTYNLYTKLSRKFCWNFTID